MVALFNYLALIGSFLSASLVLPALVGFGTGSEDIANKLLVYAMLGGFLSLSVLMATQGREIQLDRISAVYLAIISWVFFPLVLAVPIADIYNIPFGDAIFEAVSAFTTTAADGIAASETLPPAAIFLRANLQWVGGLATILTFVLFLGPIRAGGMPKSRGSIGEASGRTTTSINRIAMNFFRYFVIITLICFTLLMLSGADAFSSLVLASTAVTAGGYLPGGADLITIGSGSTLLVMSFFFLLASTNVFWHRMVFRWQQEQLRQHRESYYIIGATVVLSLVVFLAIVNASGPQAAIGSFATVSAESVFNASSLISTSGLQSRPGIFALLSPAMVIAILFVGAGCYSMAGGIKFYRMGAMFFHASNDLSKLVFPNFVPRGHFGQEDYNLRMLKPIWTMMACLMATLITGTLVLAITGMDFQASLTASAAALSNAGPAYSADWVARGTAGWPAYFEMTVIQKMVLAAIMLLGRLEVVVFIVALNPVYWLKR